MLDFLKRVSFITAFLTVVFAASSCTTLNGDATAPYGDGSRESVSEEGYPPAPRALANTSIRALDGEDFKISDLKGKVVLINLWATWCAPCIEEMPHFIKLQERYGEDGFIVVGLNSDEETDARVRTFVEKQKLNYKIGWAESEITDEFVKISKLPGIPQSLLLNRNGEMTGMFRGGGSNVIEKMVESVDKMMAKK